MSVGGAQGVPATAPGKSGGAKWGVLAIVLALVGCLGVGIIGILAAVAIPNFLSFKCKSLQTEARTNLSMLYTAEQTFRAEHGFYSSDLKALDFTPYGSPRYVYGFSQPGPGKSNLSVTERATLPADYDESRKDTTSPALDGGFSTVRMKDQSGNQLTGTSLPGDAAANHDHFRAAAVGDIHPDSSGKLDIWEMDDSHQLNNLSDDCR